MNDLYFVNKVIHRWQTWIGRFYLQLLRNNGYILTLTHTKTEQKKFKPENINSDCE